MIREEKCREEIVNRSVQKVSVENEMLDKEFIIVGLVW